MKLFYAKGTCALAPHIILEEILAKTGDTYEAVAVDPRQERSAEHLRANPMGSVPALMFDNDQSLTEGAVIVQFLADRYPQLQLAPQPGSMERIRLQEMLNFIATDVHKVYSILFAAPRMTAHAEAVEDIKNYARTQLKRRFVILNKRLETQEYLFASGYSVADAYLYTVLRWSGMMGVELSDFPAIVRYCERNLARPATQKALAAQGIPVR